MLQSSFRNLAYRKKTYVYCSIFYHGKAYIYVYETWKISQKSINATILLFFYIVSLSISDLFLHSFPPFDHSPFPEPLPLPQPPPLCLLGCTHPSELSWHLPISRKFLVPQGLMEQAISFASIIVYDAYFLSSNKYYKVLIMTCLTQFQREHMYPKIISK